MYTVLIISVIIVIIVLILSVVTTSKAYQYKHTVDPIDNNNSHAVTNESKSQEENK
ncbi:YtzI protein [Mesobacillus subterraneus]|uniref:YtzI protein n=1 Tax=Mesobacillus subterraneus TaxID=285983 RepID=UPI001CFE8B0D|nr:YtzI protein [Mesobacillus subterraneus]WLR55968.1 YtzI protein [Mesobacillus subterraneus]